jgi:hypothetical protein
MLTLVVGIAIPVGLGFWASWIAKKKDWSAGRILRPRLRPRGDRHHHRRSGSPRPPARYARRDMSSMQRASKCRPPSTNIRVLAVQSGQPHSRLTRGGTTNKHMVHQTTCEEEEAELAVDRGRGSAASYRRETHRELRLGQQDSHVRHSYVVGCGHDHDAARPATPRRQTAHVEGPRDDVGALLAEFRQM